MSAAPANTNQLVQDSWAKVAAKFTNEQVGELFYKRLFTVSPSLKTTLFKDVNFNMQPKKLIGSVEKAVSMLDEPEKLVPILVTMGERHGLYGSEEPHYAVVGENLLATLETGLGDAFTPEVKAAWTEVYGFIVDKMLEGQNNEKGQANLAKYKAKKAAAAAETAGPNRTLAIVGMSMLAAGLAIAYNFHHHRQ